MNLSKVATKQIIVVFSIIYIIANAIFIANEFYWLNLLPLVLLFIYLLFFQFERYIFILIALLPISVPLHNIITGLKFDISLPAEALIILAMLFFVYKTAFDLKFNNRLLKHPVTISVFLYLIWIFLTSVTSSIPLVSFKFLASKIWFIIVFYFILTHLFIKYKNFFTYFWCFVLPMIIVIIYANYRLYTGGMVNTISVANQVSVPFFPDHTSYAAAIAMIIPVIVSIFFVKRKSSFNQKVFFLFILVIYILALVFSYTRAAWLSLLAASFFVIPALLRIKLNITLISVIIISTLIYFNWTNIQIALAHNKQNSSASLSKHVSSVSNISTDASNLERINRWHCALKMFEEKPVLGFGPGTYMFKYAPFQANIDRTIISTNAGNRGNAHSEYLGPLAETGLIGMLSFIAIVLTTLLTASRVFLTAKRRKVKYLALALMIGLISYDFHGGMNDFLDLDKLNALFWGFTAMIVALDLYHTNSKENKSIFKY